MMEGKRAFVTGGASGIGRATAIMLAREGAQVAVSDLADPAETVEAIRDAGGTAYGFQLDVADESAVDRVVEQCAKELGGLDCAFNNAGVSIEPVGHDWGDLKSYDATRKINERGVLLCMRAELAAMERGGGGSIVNTSSVAGMSGLAGAGYCASKHAVVGLTRSAAMAYAARNIRVNCVCPGAIDTPMVADAMEQPAAAEIIRNMHPMGRLGTADEIAEAVVFLLSDRASFITGHPLAVDGGYLAR